MRGRPIRLGGFITKQHDLLFIIVRCRRDSRECAPVEAGNATSVLGILSPFVLTELGASYPFRSFEVGVALASTIFPCFRASLSIRGTSS